MGIAVDAVQEKRAEDVEDLKETVAVDTVHNDEGLRVLANYQGDQTWTAQEEKKLVRKIDMKLLSIVIVTYGLQYYDKSMFAQAVCLPSVNSLSAVTNKIIGTLRFDRRPGP